MEHAIHNVTLCHIPFSTPSAAAEIVSLIDTHAQCELTKLIIVPEHEIGHDRINRSRFPHINRTMKLDVSSVHNVLPTVFTTVVRSTLRRRLHASAEPKKLDRCIFSRTHPTDVGRSDVGHGTLDVGRRGTRDV